MKALFNMTNRELAEYLYVTASEGSDEAVYAENEVLARLNVSRDETEQGLSQVAVDAIAAFLREQGVT